MKQGERLEEKLKGGICAPLTDNESAQMGIGTMLLVVITVVVIGGSVSAFLLTDLDGDGLRNFSELTTGTEIFSADSDGDDLKDGVEVNVHGTDPLRPDSDGDKLPDGTEVINYKTDPLIVDTDGDDLDDGSEILAHGTNPLKSDTDGDDLDDGSEILAHGTNPLKSDTDEDYLSDYEEVRTYGTNPNDPDTDDDRLSDWREVRGWIISVYGLGGKLLYEERKSSNPLSRDTDMDGLSDIIEYDNRFDPTNCDTDKDGLTDREEIHAYGTDPVSLDTDMEGLNDFAELKTYGTDPTDSDTDGDGLSDNSEVSTLLKYGANPRRRDIFVEIDRMEEDTHWFPNWEERKIKVAFKNAPILNPNGTFGVRIHLVNDDVVPTYYGEFDDDVLEYYDNVLENYINNYKDFGQAFYYCLIATDLRNRSGVAYCWLYGFAVDEVAYREAGSVFMHELGHALGLTHSIFDGIDSRKYSFSEYRSVMNYNAPRDCYDYSRGRPFDEWTYLEEEGFLH